MGNAGSVDTSVNAIDFSSGHAVDPRITIAGPDASVSGGYLNADLQKAHDAQQVVVGFTQQLSFPGGPETFDDGNCNCYLKPGVQCPPYDSPLTLPHCCNPIGKEDKGNAGWWDQNDTDKKGPCWSLRGGFSNGYRDCFYSHPPLEPKCTSCNTGLCQPIGTSLLPSSKGLTDFLFISPGVKAGDSAQPVNYGAKFDRGSYSFPPSNASWIPGYTYVTCPYDRKQIMSSRANLEAFRRLYGSGTNSCAVEQQDDYYKMMRELALTRLVNVKCRFRTPDQKGLGNCAMMHAEPPYPTIDNDLATYTLNWYNSLPPQCQDEMGLDYCAQNPTDDDCGCIQRQSDPNYQLVESLARSDARSYIPPGCWYPPCKEKDASFVPVLTRTENNQCPLSICQQLIRASENAKIDVGHLSAILNCNFDTGSETKKTEQDSEAAAAAEWSKENWWVILVAALGFGIVVALIAVFVWLGRRKQS